MSRDFRVIYADYSDLAGILALLKQRSLAPDEPRWKIFCETLSCNEAETDTLRQQTPFIVVDRIGVSRGFFTLRRCSYPTYPNLLDVAIVAVERGPNENRIARTIFDHVLDLADRQQFDALRFGCGMAKAWEQQLAPDSEAPLGGTIMPLRIRPQMEREPSKSPGAAPLSHQPFVGRSADRSLSYRTDANCSRRSRLMLSA
jgi:hypothetical protein